jgi:hypothetical protein
LHANERDSPVVPVVEETLPLRGALSKGKHAFATHVGSLWSQAPDVKHVTALLCESVKPVSHANQRDWPVVAAVVPLMEPLPGACNAGAHGFDMQSGSATFQLPDVKHIAALL